MYALVVTSEIDTNRVAEADTMLKEELAPRIKQSPGFVNGTWVRSADGKDARSIIIFETENAARERLAALSNAIPADAPVTVKTAAVLEVVLQI